MIPQSCKRLAEVDFPIAVVSRHSAKEKSIRHGHPSTLHLWWARRPLAACRAMLLALLLPDPCDPHCPEDFKSLARESLKELPIPLGPADEDLRRALIKFIGDFADWDLSSNPTYLAAGRGLVKAAHGDEPPLVVDPFAGGGSIPLEALRLGCDAFASDLNPVACLILKVLLEDIPRHGPKLAEELRRVGKEIKAAAEKELAEFYPKDPDGATPIAYLWARTVRCEAPICGAEIPLVRSFWLSKKANRKRALRYKIVQSEKAPPRVEFEIFEPLSDQEVPGGTVARAKATCPCCGMVLAPERVRMQLAEQRGGADVIFDAGGRRIGGAKLLAVVTLKEGEQGRQYRLPEQQDYEVVWKAQKKLAEITAEKPPNGLSPVPDEPLPPIGTLGFRVQRYGMLQWGDLFTVRQKVELVIFAKLTRFVVSNSAIKECLALAFSRVANAGCSLCRWHLTGEKHEGVFSRQALPIVWDFSECSPLSHATGGYDGALNWVINVIENWLKSPIGQTQLSDANNIPLPTDSVSIYFTDPPYYDAVPYADLSDYFYVWLKRVLLDCQILKDPYNLANKLTPKDREIVQSEYSMSNGTPKNRVFYETAMCQAFAEGRRILNHDGIGSVVFAHKTTEGWEALLSGLIDGGWIITGSWPIATEMGSRLRARDSAALATSVHLVCRPRTDEEIGDWGKVLRELPKKVGDWMERLQAEGIRGADLVFACIGPALEIFSRYSRVETPDGREIKLPEYLMKVWEVVGRTALEQILGTEEAMARNGMAGVLEEDARLTALFLWTLQATISEDDSEAGQASLFEDEEDEDEPAPSKRKGFSLVFDVVRRFAQPLGIDLPKWEGRIIETEKGVVRLLSLSERAKQLFGGEDAKVVAQRIERVPVKDLQGALFPELSPKMRQLQFGRSKVIAGEMKLKKERDVTTLDRVHAAMLLQAAGQANGLRALIKSEMERGPDFLRLANALSALYPKDSEEKRLLDAMLLAVPR